MIDTIDFELLVILVVVVVVVVVVVKLYLSVKHSIIAYIVDIIEDIRPNLVVIVKANQEDKLNSEFAASQVLLKILVRGWTLGWSFPIKIFVKYPQHPPPTHPPPPPPPNTHTHTHTHRESKFRGLNDLTAAYPCPP